MRQLTLFAYASVLTLNALPPVQAQDPRSPEFASTEVSPEQKVTFRNPYFLVRGNC